MLRVLIVTFLLLFGFATSVINVNSFAANVNDAKDDRPFELHQEFSWIKDINLHAEKLSKAHQKEAKAIVEAATSAASKSQHCEVAKSISNKVEEFSHKSLKLNGQEESERYPNLLVFVSFSMPLEAIKALGSHANEVGGKLVFRGLFNGNFKETIGKFKELQMEVMIDPTLFESYKVKRVPTFILRQKGTDRPDENVVYHRLQGNVSLPFALEQFAAHGNEEANQLLQALRNTP